MKRKVYPPLPRYLYINPNGSQYLPDDATLFHELDDVPDGVDCFMFAIKVLPASFSINASDALTTALIQSQMEGNSSRKAPSSTQIALEELLAAIASWNYEDDTGPVPITLEAIASLEPGWLFDKMREAHEEINSAKNLRRG